MTERKLAIAPVPSAETEAEAPDPEMPATVILPALVMAAVLLEAWVMLPTVAEPPTEAVSAMLASENDATEPVAPIEAEAPWPAISPVIASVPPLLVTAAVLVEPCVKTPIVVVPARTLLLLVIDAEVTAPVALTPAEALGPLIAAMVAVPVPVAPLLLVTVAPLVAVWPIVPKESVALLVPMAVDDTDAAAPVAEIEAEAPAPFAIVAPRLPVVNVVAVLTTLPPVLFEAVCETFPNVVPTDEFAAVVFWMLPLEVDEIDATAPVAETPADVPAPVRSPVVRLPIVPPLVTAPVLVTVCVGAPKTIEALPVVVPVTSCVEDTEAAAPLADTLADEPLPLKAPVAVIVPLLPTDATFDVVWPIDVAPMVVAPVIFPVPDPACVPETDETAPVAETAAELPSPLSAVRLMVPVLAIVPPVALVELCVMTVPIEFVPAAVSRF